MGALTVARASKINAEIWGLDESITLERVQELQRMNYHESIEYLVNRKELNAHEKTLMQRWESDSEILTYRIVENENINIIRYFKAKGIYEKPLPVAQAIIGDVVLPKINRVSTHSANTIFLENNGRIYVIVYGQGSIVPIRTILMGGGQKHRRRAEWGDIQQKLVQFNLESDFFYWLFNKKSCDSTISTGCGEINILDIEGIGRSTERRQQTIRAHGSNSINEISNKTALGISQNIEDSDIAVLTPKLDAILCLKNFSECSIDINRSQMIQVTGESFSPIHGYEVSFLLYIYLEVIPGLISIYNADRSNNKWSSPLAAQVKRKWSIEVIRELIHMHNIPQSELLELIGS
jgi:hypothetical protein